MSWDNSGGPWGSSGGPWGKFSSSSGRSSQFDSFIDKGFSNFKRFFPGKGHNIKGITLIVLVILSIWLLSGFYRVQPDEQGVVLIFGQWVATEQPGLRYNFPWPIGQVETPKVTRVNRIDIGYRTITNGGNQIKRDIPDESLMVTGDENIINIDFTVFWIIKDAGQYLFKVRAPEATVKKAAESAMREVIGWTELQLALTEARQEIENQTRTLLQTMLDDYQTGIEITQIQLQQSDPPDPVIDAFNEVQRARADKERLRNEADAYRNDIIPRARGEAERLLQEAQAYKEEVISLAQGQADRFLAVLESYRLNKEVVSQRMYLETMEQILGGAEKIIIDTGPVGQQGVLPYLPLDQLLKRNKNTPN